MDPDCGGGAEPGAIVRDVDETAELQPARALAAVLVAVGAVIMCALPAATVLAVAGLRPDTPAAVLAGLASVVVVLKVVVALYAVTGRWWSEHTARLATPPPVEPSLG